MTKKGESNLTLISAHITKEQHKALKEFAEELGMSMAMTLRIILDGIFIKQKYALWELNTDKEGKIAEIGKKLKKISGKKKEMLLQLIDSLFEEEEK
jgi:hypothetical protein